MIHRAILHSSTLCEQHNLEVSQTLAAVDSGSIPGFSMINFMGGKWNSSRLQLTHKGRAIGPDFGSLVEQ